VLKYIVECLYLGRKFNQTIMKKFWLASFLILCLTNFVFAQNQTIITDKSKVSFVIKNFGVKTKGDLSGLKGKIVFDSKNLNACNFNVTIDATTINTDNNARDKHLKKSDYFDVANYPTISYVSTKITPSTIAGRFFVFGNLTIKNITKPVQFGFSATATASGYIFSGSFDINRKTFGVGGNSISLADNLSVNIVVETKNN
jgi:polyisoprenoid-binding protein YceI